MNKQDWNNDYCSGGSCEECGHNFGDFSEGDKVCITDVHFHCRYPDCSITDYWHYHCNKCDRTDTLPLKNHHVIK